jgi:hypothetical protein
MSSLPMPFDDETGWLASRQVTRAAREQAKANLVVFRHDLQARTLAAFDRADREAVADASDGALDVEIDLLDRGMARAGQSEAKLELVRRRVELLSNVNSRRIAGRFGG